MSKLVLWSGGCDSTLCLYNALEEQKKRESKATTKLKPVKTLAIFHDQCGGRHMEKIARKRLLTELRRRGYKIDHTEVTVRSTGAYGCRRGGSPQPLIWLSLALTYADPGDNIVFGYVRGDDIWHYRDRLMWAFNYLKQINERTGSLETPLEWTCKSTVLDYLKAVGLLKFCWWCENPTKKGKPCYRCQCCQSHRDARRKAFGR